MAWAELRGAAAVVTRREQLRLPQGMADTTTVVRPWLEQHKVGGDPCVMSVPGAQCIYQPFLLPRGDPRGLEAAADMEAIRFREMASEEMLHAFTRIDLAPDEKRLLLAMVRTSALDRILETARSYAIEVVDLVPSPVALFRALKAGREAEGATLYLSVGHSSTDLAIGSPAAGLLFARAFGSGGQLFSDRLARDKKLSPAQAENTKIREGSLLPDNELAAPLRAAADLWISEIEACLGIYGSVFGAGKADVARIVLAGGGGRLKGLADYLAIKLNLNVETAARGQAAADETDPMTFATADGLALCGLEPAEAHISLLPRQVRDELTFREQKPYWVGAGVAAGLILAVSLAGGFRDLRRQSTDLRAKRESLRRRQDLVEQIESIRWRTSSVNDMAAPLRTIAAAGPAMRTLLDLVAAKKAPEDLVTMICDADSYFHEEEWNPDTSAIRSGMRDRRAAAKKVGERDRQLGIQRVIIEGYTRQSSFATVKGLIEALREAQFVRSADLLSDDKLVEAETAATHRGRAFVIDVGLIQP